MTILRIAGAHLLLASILLADGGVTFTNVAPSSGVTYGRVASARITEFNQFLTGGPFTFPEVANLPMRAEGAVGVCLFDFDGDDDLDIYVTNGPGAANSLYSNQLAETGSLGFTDVAAAAGVEVTALDSTGCVAGDTDNDGDRDLYVLNMGDDNTFFENDGNGTFTESAASGLGGGARWASVTSMGDVDNDGLLDIFVGNAFDMTHSQAIYLEPVALNQHNQLFINQGGNVFSDESAAAGMESLAGMLIETPGGVVPIPGNPAGITWAVAAFDIDLDGDIDVVFGDDQGGYPDLSRPPPASGAPRADRGLMHVYLNDGSGAFSESYTSVIGSWMGVSAGDYDHDGNLDLFGSNFGDASISFIVGGPALGFQPSRWLLGDGNGTFVDSVTLGVPTPSVPGLISTPFGWGASSLDYDNDADTDIAYVGGLLAGLPLVYDNPLAIMQNDGAGNFSADLAALSGLDQQRHRLSIEHGMAVGDLNKDGFPDMVTVASTEAPPTTNPPTLFPNPFNLGGPWDFDAQIGVSFVPNAVEPDKFDFVPGLLGFPDGKLSIEINSADNGNNWVAVDVLGTIGLTTGGSVNRDGVGATVSFTPDGGITATRPILAGASYASQDALTSNFGLGAADRGTVDIQWPGGVRNRLYNVRHGATVLMPEIPCSIDTTSRRGPYTGCVVSSLNALKQAGVITGRQKARLLVSALRAYREEH